MADDKLQKLLQGGIKAAQRGEKDLARKAFLQVLKSEPENEAAWLGVATVADNNKDKLRALKRLLEINPDNNNAREAVRRMGLTPEQVLGVSAQEATPPEPEPEPEAPEPTTSPFVEDELASPSPFMFAGDDDLGEPPLPGEADAFDDLGMPPLPGEAPPPAATEPVPAPDDFDALFDDGADNVLDADDDLLDTEDDIFASDELTDDADALLDEADALLDEDIALDPEPAPEPEIDVLSLEEAFAKAPKPPAKGQGGTPIPEREAVDALASQADSLVQRYLDQALADLADVEWKEKNRGLAGQREYAFWLTRTISAVLTVLLVVGGSGIFAFVNSEVGQEILFEPTWTPSFTPTFTPTATPGATNTPSPTPDVTLTPSPTFAPSVTPGNPDPNFPPEATDIYRPQGLPPVSNEVAEASVLIAEGNLEEAFDLLERAREGSVTSGNFTPYYWLSLLQLEQDDPEEARRLVEEGEENWQNSTGRNDNYGPLVDVAYGRVDLYEAAQAIEEGETNRATQLLNDAEERLRNVVDNEQGTDRLDQNFIDGWTLLADRYLLDENPEEALAVIDDALNVEGNYTDTRLRTKLVDIYLAQDNPDAALQQLGEILLINPFLEDALEDQVQVAIQKGDPGLAVLYSEQYLLYYPGSVRGFQLLGDARQAENKVDLALNAYARGLQGEEDDPAYLDILLSRARIYENQGRYEQAQTDLTTALELTDAAPDILLRRMQAAYFAGDLERAEADANALLELEDFDAQGEVLLTQARIFIDTSDDEEDLEDALSFINQALDLGIPEEKQPVADEYRARANFALGDVDEAISFINDALTAEETGTRYYLRGVYLEERGNERDALEDLQAAREDFEFVLTWDSIFGYDFADDARERYDDLTEQIEDIIAAQESEDSA